LKIHEPSPPTVIAQGEATVKKTPDQAFLSISTETHEIKAENARRRNAENMRAIQTTLVGIGLPADSIKTTSFSLTPELEWKNGRGTMKGYIIRNQIEIRVDNLDGLSSIIDTVNSTNGTSIEISGLRFTLKNQQMAETEALKLAVQIALAKSKAIAEGAKLSIGEILRIEEQRFGDINRVEPFLMRTAAVKGTNYSETPITISDLEIKAKVILTAELK
jgi:hypothetical protein